MRVTHLLYACALAVLAAGCGSQGVGDPCNPQHPALEDGGRECPLAPGASCFLGGEIYIETRSLQCRTRVCMVYKWEEASFPTERSLRTFCSCRCGGEGDPASFCSCPEGFSCTTAFVAGDPGIRGSYCVRNEILPDAGMAGSGM
jgi:hypothetical protein